MVDKRMQQAPWSTLDRAFLKENAGKIPIRAICEHLKRSRSSIATLASREGLSLRCFESTLVWCSECASWRTALSPKTGYCKICAMRQQIKGREDECTRVLAVMDQQQRLRYEESEKRRHTRTIPIKPHKQITLNMSHYQSKRAEDLYLREMEAWEHQCLKLRYDATKKRLERMREKVGLNPRKNHRREIP